MKLYLVSLIFTIANLNILSNNASAFAKTAPIAQQSQSPKKTVDLSRAIEQFFKAGTLEESWFAPKNPPEPESFNQFRQQALQSREFILKLYGSYKNVRSQSSSRYIATFERRELGLDFKLDRQGRIAGISAK